MKNKKRIIIYIGIILLSSILSLGLSIVYQEYKQKTIPSVEKLIKEKKEQNYSDKDDYKKQKKEEIINYTNEIPSYREQYGNQYIMGRLEVPNLNINALVTRAGNNSFYLNNNLYNQNDGLGVPFFDYRNTDLANDKQINIYGHNTRNEKYFSQLPFINLEAYTDRNIFNNYKDIYLSIDEKKVHYEVIAVKIVNDSNNEHMKVIFRSDEDFLNHVGRLLRDSLYKDSNLEITSNDRLIVLQVCHYNPPDTYLLVIGKEE